MRLSCKHSGQRTIEYKDFTGGLNTSNAEETIAANELSRSINVEIDKSTGLLKTVSGTTTIFTDTSKTFTDIGYDSINNRFVLCSADKKVYTLAVDGTSLAEVGSLTGSITPGFAPWESGLLIASGGKLQYCKVDGGVSSLETISASPDVCNGVFVISGRVCVYYDDILKYSAVGDETDWTNDTNKASSSQWLQIGYKDGGKIVSISSLSSDLLIFKDNGHAYHLSGDFPSWVLREIGREIYCRSYRSYCSLANTTVVLGSSTMQVISVTQEYGDMRADDAAAKVQANIKSLPSLVKLRYMPSINQIWIIDGNDTFLFFDATCNSFFMRQYNSAAVDAVDVDGAVYVLKSHNLCKLTDDYMSDDGEALRWSFHAKTLVSYNDYLIKRARLDITPYFYNRADVVLYIGDVTVNGTLPPNADCLYHDYTQLHRSHRSLLIKHRSSIYMNSDYLYDNNEYVYGNGTHLKSINCYRTYIRCVNRKKSVRVRGKGSGGRMLFNLISFDVVEV